MRGWLSAIFALLCVLATGPAGAQLYGTPFQTSPSYRQSLAYPLNMVKLRLGIPNPVRGAGNDAADNPPSIAKDTDGSFHVYFANQAMFNLDVSSLTSYTGSNHGYSGPNCLTVTGTGDTFCSPLPFEMTPGANITAVTGHNTDACGDWPNSIWHSPYDNLWYMFVHNEGPCNYANGTTNVSMSMWTSPTGRHGSWTPLATAGLSSGTVISTDQVFDETSPWMVGFGDCTMLPDDKVAPVWMYAICAYYSAASDTDYHNAMFRAPARNMAPGQWKALRNGCYCAPALNNHTDPSGAPNPALKNVRPEADLINWVGAYAATMPGLFPIIATSWGHTVSPVNAPESNGESITGIHLAVSMSLDRPKFSTLLPPILFFDRQDFGGRPINYDAYLYQELRNDVDGGSVLDRGHFSLWYVLVAANGDLNNRWLVNQPVTMTMMSAAEFRSGIPQTAVQLESWLNTSTGNPASGFKRTTTFNPGIGDVANGANEVGQWSPQVSLGFVPQMCPRSLLVNKCDPIAAQYANRVEECVNAADDHMLEIDNAADEIAGACTAGWQHVRTIGWFYKFKPAFDANAIYACYDAIKDNHWASANDNTCSGQGSGTFLGWVALN